jgi:cytochrome c553
MRTPLRAVMARGLMLFLVAAAGVVLSEAATAEPQNIQPARPGGNLVTSGRPNSGVVACEACHRPTGEGDAGSAFSNLTGLTKEYIAKQLNDFRSGARESRVMEVVAQNLSAADIESLSLYYAGLPPLPLSTNIPEAPQIGIALAETGDARRGLRSCISCHSRKAIDVNRKTPMLHGQVPLYLRNQLISWQDGSRKNDAGSGMADIAKKISPAEIDAVSIYFARLPKSAP